MEAMQLIESAQKGNKEAREQMIYENMGLVHSIVKRFMGRGYEREDLIQIGSIGLMKAIDRFDTSFQVKFSTYAVPMISGEIKRFLRDDGMIKVSRSMKETAQKAIAAREKLTAKKGREPTLYEIAEETELNLEDVTSALMAVCEIESLNQTIYQGDGSPIALQDKLEAKKDEHSKLLNHLVLEEAISSLEEKDRQLIFNRYYLDKTQTEIAQMMGISQVQVSRIEKRVLRKMKQQIG